MFHRQILNVFSSIATEKQGFQSCITLLFTLSVKKIEHFYMFRCTGACQCDVNAPREEPHCSVKAYPNTFYPEWCKNGNDVM
jgi:hypothetical protein